jgi:tetratricopeptide (TPR) repeat protein
VLLNLGRIEEALRNVNETLALNSGNGDANALRAIIQIARSDKTAALQSAAAATAFSPSSYRAWLALSYAQQAAFKLEPALAAAQRARALEPKSSLVNARVAELLLSLGRINEAEAAARSAVDANPMEARAQTLLGFVHLAQFDTRAARADFQAAIERDSFDPLARLGLGLAIIRDGKLTPGREQIEIAVALDPTNSLLRSYVGKAYYDERRDPLDAGQLATAKGLDPKDPTPWFYDAIREQTSNQPVAALQDLQRSIELNDNRAVYRSRLLLDEDLAARSASLGRTYRDLGFEQLALVEGWKSVNTDPGDYSGHRLLADDYSTLPRHQIARVNELFQSQLLQPSNVTPVQPQLAEANLFVLDSAGPTDLAFDEFNPLFNRERLAMQASAVVGGNDTRGDDLVLAGIGGQWSYSLGQFHLKTNGFRDNNDLDQDILNAFVQFRPSHDTSVQAEIRSNDTTKGDLRLLFDPANFIPNLRLDEHVDSARVGVRQDLGGRSTLLGSFQYQKIDTTTDLPPTYSERFNSRRYRAEVQHIYGRSLWHLVSGASYVKDDTHDSTAVLFSPATPPLTNATQTTLEQKSAYVYATLGDSQQRTVTIGGSFDSLKAQPFAPDKHKFNPKVGLIWEPRPGTTIRAAAFRTLAGLSTISKQNIMPSLEPTQVAGFNQWFYGGAGEVARRYGVAIDQKCDVNVYAGGEFSKRNVAVPISFFGPPPEIREVGVREVLGRAYLYWTPLAQLALSAEYQYESTDNSGQVFGDGISQLRTHRVPLGFRFFHPSGLSAGLTSTYVDQKGEFGTVVAGPVPVIASGADTFWILDASVSYRLPKRHGVITLTANNLLDRHFHFQDTDPENPRIVPERWILLKVTLAN